MNIAALPQLEKSLAPPPQLAVKIELDERCFLFPDGKVLTHLLLGSAQGEAVTFDAVFAFNHTRRDPRVLELSLADAKGFVRELIHSVYYAKTCFFPTENLRATITVAANGYHLEFVRAEQTVELLISTGSIWRFTKGVLLATDNASPIVAN